MPHPTVPGQAGPEQLPPFVGPADRREAPSPLPLAPAKRVGVAVVGLGRLSLEAILPAMQASQYCRLAAVMTGDAAKGRRVAAAYGAPDSAVYGYGDWDRLGENPEIGFVYIVTPNGMHLAQVTEAARVGKPVLCEKPMANTAAEAEQMIAACAKAGVPLMIAYRLQYEPHHLHARRMVREAPHGKLKLIEAHNGQVQDTEPQWRHDRALAGGGALPDIGIYGLNFSRFVTGEEPVEVMGWAWSTPGDPRFAEVEENIAWQMRFPSGVVARLAAAYDAHEARGARLYFQAANLSMEPAFAYRGLRLRLAHRHSAHGDTEVLEEQVTAEQNQFGAEMDHMAGCLLSGRRPRTPGEEGLQDHRIMEAIYRSVRENRPITLPRLDGLDLFRGPVEE